MQKLLFATFLILLAWPTTALGTSQQTYASEDGAVQFAYSSDWTIEDQLKTFNQRYLYQLWTDSSALSTYLGNTDHSRMLIELVNPVTASLPDKLVTAQDYGNYILSKPINYDSLSHRVFGAFGNALEITPQQQSEDGKFNVITVAPTWFTGEPSKTKAVVVGTAKGARNVIWFPTEANRRAIFYTIVRSDGWVMFASVSAPLERMIKDERDLLAVIDSLRFDASKAAITFTSSLPDYDFSKVSLDESYVTKDGNLTLRYPAQWTITDDSLYGDRPIGIFVRMQPPDERVQVNIFVMDATEEDMGLSPTQDTPEEFMQEERANASSSQFRIANHDAVKVMRSDNGKDSLEIYFALNDSWVASAGISADNTALLSKYEAEVVAMLASLKLTLGESVIDFEVLHATLPDTWIHKVNTHNDGDYYNFVLQPSYRADFSNRLIIIEFVNLHSRGFSHVTLDDLKRIIGQLVTREYKSRVVTIGNYETLRVETYSEANAIYGQYTLWMVNEDWLVVVEGLSTTREVARGTLRDINAIISAFEISLPTQSIRE